MASYNSILRHVYMTTVKRNTLKLQEQRREEERRIQEKRDEIRYKNSPLYSDWRFDLSENMTTQAMTYATTLPGEGDTVLGDVSGWVETSTSDDVGGVSASGNTIVLTPNNIPIGDTGGSFQQTIANSAPFDARDMTSAKVTLTRTRAGVEDSNVRLFANYGSNPNQFFINAFFGVTGSASRLINIANYQNLDKLRFQVRASSNKKWSIDDPNDPDYGTGEFIPVDTSDYTLKIEYQRRTPITVFIALDSPEATAFVRTGEFSKLSNEEKKKKLQDMLSASDEYLAAKFGDAFPGTGVILDTGFDEIASAQQGPMPTGPSGYKPPGSYDPNKFYNLAPGSLPSPNIPYTGPGQSNVPGTTDYENVAATYGGKEAEDRKKIRDMLNDPKDPFYLPKGKGQPGKGRGMGDRWLPSASTGSNIQVAHYEPEGEVLSEKKSFKDLTKKIPGYYDGKPAPLGFPMEEPPPQIKGLHPDLVTGEKVSQRFNRLDPISAKAMPRTGIKAIDKKVAIAKKKPK